jgi:hypothetical protein
MHTDISISVEAKGTTFSVPLWLTWFVSLTMIAIVLMQPSLEEVLGSPLSSLHFVFIIISAGFVSSQVSKAQPNLILFMVWNFNYCVFGLAGYYQLKNGISPWPVLVSANSFQIALAAELAMSMILTFLVATSRTKSVTSHVRAIKSQRKNILCFILLPFIFFVVQIVADGNLGYFFTSRVQLSEVSDLSRVQRGLYLVACQSMTLCVSCLSIREYRLGNRSSFTIWGLIVGVAGLIVLCNPFSSTRYWVLTCVTTLVLSNIELSAFLQRLFAAQVVFGTLVIFPLANYFRSGNRKFGFGKSALLTGDFDALQLSGIGVDWWSSNGSTWGEQLSGSLFFWVPRSYWQSKPIDTGEMLATWAGLKFTNLSGPWVAEALVNFGLLGVIIFPAIAYLALRRQLASVLNDDFGIVSYAFLVGYTPILIRGSLLQAMGYLATFLGCLLFATGRVTASKAPPPPDC